jgi:hypothetical protein
LGGGEGRGEGTKFVFFFFSTKKNSGMFVLDFHLFFFLKSTNLSLVFGGGENFAKFWTQNFKNSDRWYTLQKLQYDMIYIYNGLQMCSTRRMSYNKNRLGDWESTCM